MTGAAKLESFYSERRTAFIRERDTVAEKIKGYSNLRILVALVFIFVFFLAVDQHNLFYALPFVAIVFAILVRKHAGLFDRKQYLDNLIRIQSDELRILKGDCSAFDPGAEFIDPHHPYSHDLDIFGEGSIFQHVNRCNTIAGKGRLARLLQSPLTSVAEIRKYQDAVHDLSLQPEVIHDIRASGMQLEETRPEREALFRWAAQPNFMEGRVLYRLLLIALPLITLSLLVLTIFSEGYGVFFWLSFIASWAIIGFHVPRINEFHENISRKRNILMKYARILQVVEPASFSAIHLKELSSRAKSSHRNLDRLASLATALDARLNILTSIFVNGILLFDLQCVYRLEKWKRRNAPLLRQWMDAVDEIEMLGSLATFAFNNPSFNFPDLNETNTLTARAAAHPLLLSDERVHNDLVIDRHRSVTIITGANMAGKSTFLRTIGVNVVLAQIGAPVCAEAFDCPVVQLRTGMRTADSLRDHQSYFYAELNRLQSIVEELRNGKPLLILLDEILKGTNSTDKLAGSVALVKQFTNLPCLVVIATHDLALADLEKAYPDRIRNFCFEPSIELDQLSFDYKLRPGRAEKMNATFLMRKMGIIPREKQ